MIPPEHGTQRSNELQAKLNDLGGDLSKLENLTSEDFRIIGAYVQIYNFIEFNGRRCVEIFARAHLLNGHPATKPQRIHISNLVKTVKSVVAQMDAVVEDVPNSLAMLDEIELRRAIRNLLAHWSARRLPGEDAIVLLTMSGFDERQISGADRQFGDHARTAILDLADVRGLLVHMAEYEKWIGHKVAEWYARYLPSQ